MLQNLSTTNASLVNGTSRLISILRDGDMLTFGEKNFVFRQGIHKCKLLYPLLTTIQH